MKRSASVRRTLVAVAAITFILAYPAARFLAGAEKTYTAEQIKRGEYLATLGGCHDCHSPKIYDAAGIPSPDPKRLLSGHPANETVPAIPAGVISPTGWVGLTNAHFSAWAGPWGVSFAANLTPHQVNGTGAWTEEAFIDAMRTGKHLGMGRDILPPMPWFNLTKASDEDLAAIFAYLQSLPPIDNQVPQPIPPQTN